MTKRLLIGFFLILTSCGHTQTTEFDGKWTIIELMPGRKSGCLSQSDVIKLRKVLLQCQKQQ